MKLTQYFDNERVQYINDTKDNVEAYIARLSQIGWIFLWTNDSLGVRVYGYESIII